MSRVSFENYGRFARALKDPTRIAGRYALQRDAERLISVDVMRKLAISPSDRLLEIGCGPGSIVIPLSFMVKEAVGIDHPDVCNCLHERISDKQVQAIPGNFLDIEFDVATSFDKVLVYGVLSTLASEEEAFSFIDKALSLVAPGGRLLVGDIPNRDMKVRFFNSQEGRRFQEIWEHEQARIQHDELASLAKGDPELLDAGDSFVMQALLRYRKRGYEAWTEPQPESLPFGHTREDLIVARLN